MENEEYQVLIRRPGDEARTRLLEGSPASHRDALARVIDDVTDTELPDLLADLGGHDQAALEHALRAADRERTRPTVLFAYTIKGWRLPFAGDSINHSALLQAQQVEALSGPLGADPGDPWAAFPDDSAAHRLCMRRRRDLGPAGLARAIEPVASRPAVAPEVRIAPTTSTQQTFGDTLASLARDPTLGPRLVTAAPDVAVSTNLGGWINRAGVFAAELGPDLGNGRRPLDWTFGPRGRHIELGISEMNLFMWLSQFGLTGELFGERLAPIGTVYDPFIARGLDALIYALYVKSRFVLVGTPSGITLAPEGGAHQSTVTPSLGIELPGLRAYEPVFGREVVWTLLEGIRGCLESIDGFATYLRLGTRPIDQSLAGPIEARLGLDGWRDAVLAGGYRLLEATSAAEPLPRGSPVVHVVATGSIVPEAIEAVRTLHREEVAANLIVVTSAERLAAGQHGGRLSAMRTGRPDDIGHLGTLIPPPERHAPIVTVADAASHALSFIGGAFGAPVVPLGVDTFGQSGAIPDLYAAGGIDADHIVDAAILALDLGGGA
jgi:pyruvate dehydrogenase E1 component